MEDVEMRDVDGMASEDTITLPKVTSHAPRATSPPARFTSPDDGESSMVKTRERRTTAGNNLRRLLALEKAEDRQKEEDETFEGWQDHSDDEEFGGEEAEDKGDVSLESSSDEDEDEGDQDEEQGEKELKKQERAQRTSRKQNAREMLLQRQQAPNKRPNLVGITSSKDTSDSRPRKKSERVSWLPTEEEGPVRQSSRTLALQNKAETHERLKVKERNRMRTLAIMQAAEQRKAKQERKRLTQEERLAEAARVERTNLKSLNRWKEAEKRRQEEQHAKLEALKNRKMNGSFVQYWSGQSIWLDDKLKHVGKGATAVEIEEGYNKPPKQIKAVLIPAQDSVQPQTAATATADNVPATTAPQPDQAQHHNYGTNIMFDPPAGPASFLDTFLGGIDQWANLPDAQPIPAPGPSSQAQPQPEQPTGPPPRRIATTAARTLISLQNIDTSTLNPKEKDAFLRLLLDYDYNTPLPQPIRPRNDNSKYTPLKHLKPQQTLCAITNQPARYRDPATGLPYADSYAYKCIQRLVNGTAQWSGLLGCYVGTAHEMGRPATGVPERFRAKSGGGGVAVKREEGGPVQLPG